MMGRVFLSGLVTVWIWTAAIWAQPAPGANDDNQAMQRYRQAAEQGDAEAQFQVGEAHEKGRGGLVKDDAQAVNWYRKAAGQGHAATRNGLATMYREGRGGLPNSEAKAQELYHQAAAQGHAPAQTNLAVMYLHGRGGLTPNAAKALGLMRQAAEQGYAPAQSNLGVMYRDGQAGGPPDIAAAVAWFRKAADQGHAHAQFNLGLIYATGRDGWAKDESKAAVLYRKAAEQGEASAQVNLGSMYQMGQGGLIQDYEKAADWYRKAAKQGDATAQLNLGYLYEDGHGVAKDEATAVRWYQEAALRGNRTAFGKLAGLYSQGRALPADRTEAKNMLDGGLGVLGQALQDRALPVAQRLRLCDEWIAAYAAVGLDRKIGFDAVAPIVEKVMGSLIETVRGRFYIKYAWDGRTDKLAGRVTEEQWKLFEERLVSAQEALEQAWKRDPTNAFAATAMLSVELGQGQGSERMELWYRRAKEADPNNFVACTIKAQYLQPKWHGSEKELLAFGRECVETQNWRARLPLILVEAHLHLAGYSRDETTGEIVQDGKWGNRPSYWQRPGVWDDVRSVYDKYLKLVPGAAFDRSLYAKLACWCGQWPEADRQFRLLGQDVRLTAFKSKAEYDELRAKAAQGATAK